MKDKANEVHVQDAVEWPEMNKVYILKDYRALLPKSYEDDFKHSPVFKFGHIRILKSDVFL
jgi:hypothetical protein